MPQQLVDSPWIFAALVLAVLGFALLLAALLALITIRPFKFLTRTLAGVLFLAISAAAALVGLGTQGYRPFMQEEVAARMSVRPTGPQRFTATFRFPDGRSKTFDLAGDEIYVDAHILKWHPWANLLGLRAAYQLDRVTGRYQAIEKERAAPRTVHPLADDTWVSLFRLRQQLEWLNPVLDAEYGSATFTPVNRPAELEVRVTPSGLLMREVAPGARPG
jgi:hypothetical protein